MKWDVFYAKAIQDDGSLFFPERLTKEFLENAKRVMGSYLFSNQYQNEIIPEEDMIFKPQWIRYYRQLPVKKHTFAFIDPAISKESGADYTALVIVDVDLDGIWYVRTAQRYRISPTQLVDLVFKVNEQFKPTGIGIENIAFQDVLLQMVSEEMNRRGTTLPVTGISTTNIRNKHGRIRTRLVPRFEWGRLYLAQGLTDLEMELLQFPRGAHDDLLDALAYIDDIVFYPEQERDKDERLPPNHPDYEKQYIRKLSASSSRSSQA